MGCPAAGKARLFPRRNRFFGQFAAFVLVGAVATMLHFFILWVMVDGFALEPFLASGFGYGLSSVVNYSLNRSLTFNKAHNHQRMVRFFCVSGSGLLLNSALMFLLTATPIVHYLIAQALVAGCVLVWNFLMNRYWTFV